MLSGYKDGRARGQRMGIEFVTSLRTIAEGICAQPLSGRGQRNFMMDGSHAAADL
jgi:hypothetical protein